MWGGGGGAAACSALPTADENAVTESAVTIQYLLACSSLPRFLRRIVHILLGLAVWNLQATRVLRVVILDVTKRRGVKV